MTVKTETNFYKNVKKLLENGDDKFIVTRIESYATPGFPDCIIYHNDLGFFTIELKVVQRSKRGIGKVLISPLQAAWHLLHVMHGAPVYILVYDPGNKVVNLFGGDKLPKLRKLHFLANSPSPSPGQNDKNQVGGQPHSGPSSICSASNFS